jgi:hypothetical protein
MVDSAFIIVFIIFYFNYFIFYIFIIIRFSNRITAEVRPSDSVHSLSIRLDRTGVCMKEGGVACLLLLLLLDCIFFFIINCWADIPVNKQGLSYRNFLLDDEKALAGYGVGKGSSINLLTPLVTSLIFAKIAEGRKILLEVCMQIQ